MRVVPLRIRMKIRAGAPPTQRIADPRAGAISSKGTPPALENTTVLGTEVLVWAVFSKEVQGLLPCVSWAWEFIQMNGLLCPCKTQPARPHRCELGISNTGHRRVIYRPNFDPNEK
ncbi:unnamed protein product, partial [Staurois parvus]